ncbi:MAG: Multifunctional protein [Pseudomonadota bacterium]|jgi:tRNA nucleotidyltransferase (CCA-adding enzyme)
MKIYLVGGAVRDALMQTPNTQATHSDRDWVVVGATPQALQARGFLPVGRDFPVFLHPHTREEYALARTERKTAPGYHGFAFHAAPGVTLEDDLARRDLTINAMAVAEAQAHDPASAHLIDPHGGQRDLQARVLRHVTSAFAEDPVRILRVARFAARFPDFSVAPETLALMRQMVEQGEVDHLVAERVWQELARGLMEQRPSRMLTVLRDCGALVRLLPEVDRLWGVAQRADYHPEVDTGIHLMMVLDMSARLNAPLAVRFACLGHDLGKGNTPAHVLPRHLGHETRSAQLLHGVCERWRVPRECRELADVVAREHGNIHRSSEFDAAALLRLLERCDALRRPERFDDVLLACECDARGRLGFEETAYPQRPRLRLALQAALTVDSAALAAGVVQRQAAQAIQTASAASLETAAPRHPGPQIAQAIHAARVRAIAQHLKSASPSDEAAPSTPA